MKLIERNVETTSAKMMKTKKMAIKITKIMQTKEESGEFHIVASFIKLIMCDFGTSSVKSYCIYTSLTAQTTYRLSYYNKWEWVEKLVNLAITWKKPSPGSITLWEKIGILRSFCLFLQLSTSDTEHHSCWECLKSHIIFMILETMIQDAQPNNGWLFDVIFVEQI